MSTLHIILHLVRHKPTKWFSDNQDSYNIILKVYIQCKRVLKQYSKMLLKLYIQCNIMKFILNVLLFFLNVFTLIRAHKIIEELEIDRMFYLVSVCLFICLSLFLALLNSFFSFSLSLSLLHFYLLFLLLSLSLPLSLSLSLSIYLSIYLSSAR